MSVRRSRLGLGVSRNRTEKVGGRANHFLSDALDLSELCECPMFEEPDSIGWMKKVESPSFINIGHMGLRRFPTIPHVKLSF